MGAERPSSAIDRLSVLAGRQFGRVSRLQLLSIGVDNDQIKRWIKTGYLLRVHARVYSVGHTGPSLEADLFAALLYAGPGAMLSHGTAAWWIGLVQRPPDPIHVSTPRRCGSLDDVVVHDRREHERVMTFQAPPKWGLGVRPPTRQNNGVLLRLPSTSIAQTAVDLAGVTGSEPLRLALAELDYRRALDVGTLREICARGRDGSAALKAALQRHQPRLARTRSPLEIRFLELCERHGVPLPEVNAMVHDRRVDAVWRRERVVVELDGEGNHGTWSQIKRDRSTELALRGHGFDVVRYSSDQVDFAGEEVSEDLRARLRERGPRP